MKFFYYLWHILWNAGETGWEKVLSSPSEGDTLLIKILMSTESGICNVPSEKFMYYYAKCTADIPDLCILRDYGL